MFITSCIFAIALCSGIEILAAHGKVQSGLARDSLVSAAVSGSHFCAHSRLHNPGDVFFYSLPGQSNRHSKIMLFCHGRPKVAG